MHELSFVLTSHIRAEEESRFIEANTLPEDLFIVTEYIFQPGGLSCCSFTEYKDALACLYSLHSSVETPSEHRFI